MLLATSALASAALPATAAYAGDATWNPGSADFNTGTNWTGAPDKTVPDGTATFGSSQFQAVTFSQATTLGGITVASGAGLYTFNTKGNEITFNGAGLSAQTGARITFSNDPGSAVLFTGSASAGSALINNGAALTFTDNSTAGQAIVDINAAVVTFTANSNAGSSTLTLLGDPAHGIFPTLEFNGNSSADHATITVISGDTLNFLDSGSAGSARITNDGTTAFFGNSTAGQATIANNLGGALEFRGNASAGSATITNKDRTTFFNSSTAGSATITNESGALTDFLLNSTADRAHITNSGSVYFESSSTAANAAIVNHGTLDFFDTSTAGNAFIESDGAISFHQKATGGNARIKLDNGGTLDLSGLNRIDITAMTLGSLEGSGNVFLASRNLAVGGNDLSTVFSGVIQDGQSDSGGSLTKEGKGAFTLTGVNTYTGATTVNGGALIVDGSIASSSNVTVNADGTLAGTGTVSSNTTINGGTLAPGDGPGSFGTLKIGGNLSFTAAATYLVQVSPTAAASTSVIGTATLGGATVAANFAPGTYLTRQYGILNASGGRNGTFGSLVNTNLSSIFKTSLSYDANNVFLNVTAPAVGGDNPPGGVDKRPQVGADFNTNQRNVANGLVNSFNLMSGIPIAFATLAPAGLTQVSGETAVGTQQATFDAMNQFMGVMLDPTIGGRSGGGLSANDAYAAMSRKAPAPAAAGTFTARWNVWAAGFGGSQSISGDAVLGSNKTTSSVFGSAAGAEYRFSPNTTAGFALAGGGTHFNVANGGSGSSDLFQAGAYFRHTQGAAFLSAALAYGWQDVTTNRTVTVAGIDHLRGSFNANAVSGRIEGGYRVATAAGDITPYAAGQFTTYRLPSYVEQATAGTNTFALSYSGKDVTATRTELGFRGEKAVPLTEVTLTLRGRLAWAHDYNTDRNVQAAFVTLPGSAFVVNGALPAADTALASVSAETLWQNGWSAALTADAQLSDTTHGYSGKGVVRYNW